MNDAVLSCQREDLDVLECLDSYHRYIHSRLARWYGERIWESGAGTGNMAVGFPEGRLILATDSEPSFLVRLRERLKGRPETYVRHFDLLDSSEGFRELRLDSAVSFNVLEHIADDLAAARSLARPLATGGRVVILVPAGQAIYGELDAAIGHYRRYDKARLRRLLARAGLDVEAVFYLNLPGVLGWFVNSVLLARTTVPQGQSRWFDRAFRYWAPIEERLPLPFGLSVVGIGRKRA